MWRWKLHRAALTQHSTAGVLHHSEQCRQCRDISVGPQAPLSLPTYFQFFPSLQKAFPVAGLHVPSGPSSQCGSNSLASGSSLRAAVLQEAPRPPAASPITHCAPTAGWQRVTCLSRRETLGLRVLHQCLPPAPLYS